MDQVFMPLVANQFIQEMVKKLRTLIKENDLHRWELKKYELNYASSDPSIYSHQVLLQKLLFAGAGSLDAKDVQYDSSTSSLHFEMTVPQLMLQSGESHIVVKLWGTELNSNLSGRIVVKNLRLFCKAQLVSRVDAVQLDNWDIKVTIASITSNVTFTVYGMDFSSVINKYLSEKLPEAIKSLSETVTAWLGPFLSNIMKIPVHNEINDMF